MIKTSFIEYFGLKIAVRTAGSGSAAIIFLHGNSMSGETWNPQLENETLLSKYRLFAVDFPGHGSSQWTDDRTYLYRPGFLGMLIEILVTEFALDRFMLVGLSYGTSVIGEIKAPVKGCAGIVLTSSCIFNKDIPVSLVITPGEMGHVIVSATASENELEGFVTYSVTKRSVVERFKSTYRQTDPKFREALGQALFEGDTSDQLANIAAWELPVCVVFGVEDRLLNKTYLDRYPPLWKKTFLVKNAGHVVNEENSEEFNQILLDFAYAML